MGLNGLFYGEFYFALPYVLQRFGLVKLFGWLLIGLPLRSTYWKPGNFMFDM